MIAKGGRSVGTLWLVVGFVAAGCGPKVTVAPPTVSEAPQHMSTPFIVPGVRMPTVLPARTADLADDAEVLGVVVDGKARAYTVKAMSSMMSHVVNDVIGLVPVTVTFCDRTDCARLFTSEKRGRPLAVELGGYDEGMLIRDNGVFYRQADVRPTVAGDPHWPHPDLPVERTTWKAWKEKHPNTDVYVGPKLESKTPEAKTP